MTLVHFSTQTENVLFEDIFDGVIDNVAPSTTTPINNETPLLTSDTALHLEDDTANVTISFSREQQLLQHLQQCMNFCIYKKWIVIFFILIFQCMNFCIYKKWIVIFFILIFFNVLVLASIFSLWR